MAEEGPTGDVPDPPDPPAAAPAVDAADLYSAIAAGESVRLLDVRDRDEVDAWHIDGPGVTFTHVPLSRFLQAQVTDGVADLAAEIDGEGPITAVCAAGEASAYAAGLLADAGVEARNLGDGMAGWARVYTATEIATDPTIVQYHRPSSGCLSYLVADGGEAAVVDPLRAFVDRYVADAADRDVDVVAVLDTHLHADHVSGVRDLADATGAERYLPTGSYDRGVTDDVEPIVDGDRIAVGDAALRAVALPGHTTGMTGLAIGDVLLTGDSLFLEGVARPDLQVAADDERAALARTLHETLVERLAVFDGGTLVAPGHVAGGTRPDDDGSFTATLGTLRDRLAAFDVAADAFVESVLADLPPEPANVRRIVDVNTGRETVDAATAFELELGPNNCAAGTWSG
jgi:glyoxylase-like metal-dependent hydrolase (beta-lactamase superfamily II)/rhodanese-related sulfurtransferase